MSLQSGVPYEKRQPSPELRSFLDPLKPGSYFDCGRARLYGIDEVLEQEAERRDRPVGHDHFQLVATDGGLIFCRASITFAIAARWKDVSMERPVERPNDERVDLAVVWPTHGELTFTVSRRLASNIFRRWLQFQAQNSRRHQVEQAARYERSQRLPQAENIGSSLAASPMPAPETLQLDEAEREVLLLAVQSGDIDSRPPARSGVEDQIGSRRSEPFPSAVDETAATTHFEPEPQANSRAGFDADEIDLTDRVPDRLDPGSDDDWRNSWAYGDGGERPVGADPRQASGVPVATSDRVAEVAPEWSEAARMERAMAETAIFPDTFERESTEPGPNVSAVRVNGAGRQDRIGNGRTAVSSKLGGRRSRSAPNGHRPAIYDPRAEQSMEGRTSEPIDADPESDENGSRPVGRDDFKQSRGGYLDGLPNAAGDAALASSGPTDRATRPDPSPRADRPNGRDGARSLPVPQISGARLQSPQPAARRRSGDGLDIRSVVLADPEPSLLSDLWHRHRITIMATISLITLLIIAVSSLLSRGDGTAAVDVDPTDIAIPTRAETGAGSDASVDPAGSDEGVGVDGETADDATGSAQIAPNSPLVVDDGSDGAETSGSAVDGGEQSAVDVTETTAVRICHSNYGGCVPVAPDVDCEGDGDGPAYLSEPVVIFGEDVYDLDTDGDREACDEDQPASSNSN